MNQPRLCLDAPTSAEISALSAYKSAEHGQDGKSACFQLNRELEHSLTLIDMASLGGAVKTLDGVFSRCPRLLYPMTVYRALGLRWHYPFVEEGARFRNRSFWSASTNRDVAIKFLKAEFPGAGGALLKLNLPAGIPAYDMETLDGAGGGESELLLPRGLLWHVGTATLFEKDKYLLEHVAKQFGSVAEVSLSADLNWPPVV